MTGLAGSRLEDGWKGRFVAACHGGAMAALKALVTRMAELGAKPALDAGP